MCIYCTFSGTGVVPFPLSGATSTGTVLMPTPRTRTSSTMMSRCDRVKPNSLLYLRQVDLNFSLIYLKFRLQYLSVSANYDMHGDMLSESEPELVFKYERKEIEH